MPNCAVCGTKNNTLVCKSCGFDGSCNYEKYPSLGRPAQRPDTVSRRRAALEAKNAAAQAAAAPKKPVPQKPATPTPPPAQKPVTQTPPVSKPVTSTPPVQKPASQTPPVTKPVTSTPPVQKPAPTTPAVPAVKRSRGFLEKLTLLLGWILAGLIILTVLYDIDGSAQSDSIGPVTATLAVTLLMLWRLHRKGFRPLFGTRIPYGLHCFLYGFGSLDFAVTTVVGFFATTEFKNQLVNDYEKLILTALVVVMPSYLMFWSLGQLRSRKKN